MWDIIQGFLYQVRQQTINLVIDGKDIHAVDLTDPVGFTSYLGLAFVLYAIRETDTIPTRFMPIIAIVLGILYAVFVEYKAFSEGAIIAGLRMALLGIGSVATVKYFLEDKKDKKESIE